MGKVPRGYWECPNCLDYVEDYMDTCPHCKTVSPKRYSSPKSINGEYRVRCNVCGKIYCYTEEDLKANKANKTMSVLGAASAALNSVAGSRYDAYESMKISDRNGNRIVDYNRCPNCNSTNISVLTDEEWEREQRQNNPVSATTSNTSVVDEIKRYKELLDVGILTQEEFDAKKKQLLGI